MKNRQKYKEAIAKELYKNSLATVISYFIVLVVSYLAVSLIFAEFNPFNWHIFIRGLYAGLGVGLFLAFVHAGAKKSDEIVDMYEKENFPNWNE